MLLLHRSILKKNAIKYSLEYTLIRYKATSSSFSIESNNDEQVRLILCRKTIRFIFSH